MRAHDGEPRSGDGRVVLAGARVVTPAGTLRSGWVAVQGGVIAALGQGLPAADGAPVQDLSGAWLVPGFVDMHVHGGGGAWLASLDPEEVDQAVRFHLGKGTTSMLASIATSPLGSMLRSAAVVAGAAAGAPAPALAGIHLEGPFISRERSGAQDPDAIRDPDPAVMGRLLEACGGWARMVTIAPELPGGLDLVRQIARSGAVPAVGHTQAGYEAATAAIDAGVRVSTHLFNAMPGLHHRDLGTVGAALSRGEVICELVNDGVHLRPEVVRLVSRRPAPSGSRWSPTPSPPLAWPTATTTSGGCRCGCAAASRGWWTGGPSPAPPSPWTRPCAAPSRRSASRCRTRSPPPHPRRPGRSASGSGPARSSRARRPTWWCSTTTSRSPR